MEPSPLAIVFDFDIFDKILLLMNESIGGHILLVKGSFASKSIDC